MKQSYQKRNSKEKKMTRTDLVNIVLENNKEVNQELFLEVFPIVKERTGIDIQDYTDELKLITKAKPGEEDLLQEAYEMFVIMYGLLASEMEFACNNMKMNS